MKIFLKDPDATADFGIDISKLISDSKNNVIEIHLVGELGAGKTFLTKSILKNSGWSRNVKSPTYTLCEEYEIDNKLLLLGLIFESVDISILNLTLCFFLFSKS